MDDVNPFNVLSNEVILHIISSLDARSLFRFCGCSKRLQEFNNLSNDNWRKLYSEEWLADERELFLYADRDWMASFKRRYAGEIQYGKREDNNATSKYLRLLLRSENVAEIVDALDHLDSSLITDHEITAQILSTALAKVIRSHAVTTENSLNYIMLLFSSVRVCSQPVPGAISVATHFLDLKFDTNTLLKAPNVIKHCLNGANQKFRFEPLDTRLLDIIEKCPDLAVVQNAMEIAGGPMRLDIGNRPLLANRVFFILEEFVSTFAIFDATILFILNLLQRSQNRDFLLAQGAIQRLFQIALKVADPLLFGFIIRLLEEFSYDNRVALDLARDHYLLNSLLTRVTYLRENSSEGDEGIFEEVILGFFGALVQCEGTMQYLWQSPYLEFVLPFLEHPQISPMSFALLYRILSKYVRYGVETRQVRSIYDRFELYCQTLIEAPEFKNSIETWQTLYCGMKLPENVATILLDRIMGDLFDEENEQIKCYYSRLLSNMVLVDRDLFLTADLRKLFDYYSRELLNDARIKNNSHAQHAETPSALFFISSASSFQQFGEWLIAEPKILEKMYSLCDQNKETKDTIYLVVYFFSHVVQLPGWNNQNGLTLLERWGADVPLEEPISHLFNNIGPFRHIFMHDNPVELLLFGTWIIARTSQRQDGRDGLQELSPEIIEWLSNHADPRLRKHMIYYHQNLHRAQMEID